MIPSDPEITDWGSLEAARARHAFHLMGTPVYDQPHHRAAALLHQLVRVPALEHSNELFAVAVAAAYLHASGHPVDVTSEDAITLVDRVLTGEADAREIAATLKTWAAPDS
ncbi:fic family toxin-antitoxin system, toxin component [Streptomyces sp. R302]|nr:MULTISPECIES: fic family toxin-antitoxin system, toxin component [unclassified Streptomyces]NML53886.1 fic family toxin-antitoxin system, toxin component [Streptomyces sp. R301]NML83145.1 fic family toxin-antitoxin system, toxin component [Streptomyces sp. R302]